MVQSRQWRRRPSISSGCRSTSAATGAASTWGRRRSASPGSPNGSRRSALPSWTRGDLVAPDPGGQVAGRSQKEDPSARSRRSARSSTRRRSRRSTRGDSARPRRRSQPGVRVGRGDGGLRAARRQTARTDLGRRARRHEHAGDAPTAATCTACRSRRCSAPSRPSCRGSADSRRRSAPSTRCSSASAISTSARKTRARLGRARLHDEGHRSLGHRVDRRAGPRDSPAPAPPGSTCRSISTSAIRRSPRVSARR